MDVESGEEENEDGVKNSEEDSENSEEDSESSEPSDSSWARWLLFYLSLTLNSAKIRCWILSPFEDSWAF